MKWLAQLKIQERGRVVVLKEAAAVQQPEKKKQKEKRHLLHISTREVHTENRMSRRG